MDKVKEQINTALAALMGLQVSGGAAIAMGQALTALLAARELLEKAEEGSAP